MKNQKYYGDQHGRGLAIALPVPDGTVSGRPTTIGPAGDPVLVVPFTERQTPAQRALGWGQGLKDGEASCYVPGFGQILDLGAMPAGVVIGQKVYLSAAGMLTTTTTDLYVGRVMPIEGPGGGLGVAIRVNT
ncbi:hypothetical protein [Deinococcus multiflagellatus]|uniref:Uncharacterized protein n=1 Tax=Deinococcus multiflagellatus TaxID=1656887 RepID=A0ABW1ZRZ0_9DEIO|nr:hypothetical protein [Deinococcus multiflagellatus]MBZ9715498.1 hypothetical protein [Deinococcus multiflagellatus]